MPRKRRKSREERNSDASPVEDDSLTHNPFAAALSGLDTQPEKKKPATAKERADAARERALAREAEARREAERLSRARRAATDDPALESGELDDEAMFAAAIDGMAPADLYQGKYGTREDPKQRADAARSAKRLDPDEAARMVFEQAMSQQGIKRMSPRRIERALPKPSVGKENLEQVKARVAAAQDPAGLKLDAEQRKILERARRHERDTGPMPTVTLRGLDADGALERLTEFVSQHAHEPWLRVITGKGRQSEGEPVLKSLAAKFLDGRQEVARFVPEVGRDGDFGAYVLQMRRSD